MSTGSKKKVSAAMVVAPELGRLSAEQFVFASELAATGDVLAAAAALEAHGFPPKRTEVLRRDTTTMQAVRYLSALQLVEAVPRAVVTLRNLVTSETTPAHVRVAAAKTLLEHAKIGASAAAPEARGLDSQTTEALQAALAERMRSAREVGSLVEHGGEQCYNVLHSQAPASKEARTMPNGERGSDNAGNPGESAAVSAKIPEHLDIFN